MRTAPGRGTQAVPLPGGPQALWHKPQFGLELEIDHAAHGFNPWSISARSEHMQPKHGANESAYDTSRGRESKNKVQYLAHEES